MRTQQLGICISFSLHILITALVMMAVSQPIAFNAPMGLNFLLISAQKASESKQPAPLRATAEKQERISRQEKNLPPKPLAPKSDRLMPPDPIASEKNAATISAKAPAPEEEQTAAPRQASNTEPQNAPELKSYDKSSAPERTPTSAQQITSPTAQDATIAERYAKENYAFIQDSIKNMLIYPRLARKMGWEGKVMVCFEICLDGHIENIRIVESSGHPVLDRNALETIRQAAPFALPPARAELTVPVIYSLRDA